MKQTVFNYMEEHHMLEDGDSVLVGVSGGADSVCLLYLLKEYAKIHSVRIQAAHVHHGLRENADLDEAFVRNLCAEWEIPLKTAHIDVASFAAEQGMSLEEAGRIKRYEFFEELLKQENINRIAVAHHRDDLCETMLFQLFRGTGIHGLHGILPVAGNRIRPLLCVGKEEIEAFLTGEGIGWRVDESNADTQYARNRIRHEILPIAEEICQGAKEHMALCAERVRLAEELLDAEIGKCAERLLVYLPDAECSNEPTVGRRILIRKEIMDEPLLMRQELVLKAMTELAGRKKDLGTVQVEAVLKLLVSPTGKRREFIYGILANKTREGVVLSLRGSKPEQ